MKRISSGIFIAPGHKVAWSNSTKYLSCECKQFAFNSKCDIADRAREILESEGKKVKFKRKPSPIFIKEIDVFTERLSKIFRGEE